MKSVPITYEFNGNLNDLLGEARLSDEAIDRIKNIIEQGMLPEFAISFNGKINKNGFYHDVELIEISMIVRKTIKHE
jgi:hypothetical protein